jgi:intracellular sulfur oxidation DsrE/DsrF family protein
MTRIGTMVLAAMVAAAGTAAAADDYFGQQKVVYHINYDGGEDGNGYRPAMTNIQNHIDAVGMDNLEVKVVLHGDGLNLLRAALDNQALQMDVTSLKAQNVEFRVCQITIDRRDISYEDDLFEVWDDDIVPSGVAEIARLQQMGYAYIKP